MGKMDKRLVASELLKAVEGLKKVMAARAPVPTNIWESLKKMLGRDLDGSYVAKLTVRDDGSGNPVGNDYKTLAYANGQYSLEKKLEEMGHPEIKVTFKDENRTFVKNAIWMGLIESEADLEYVEPPENIVNDIIAAKIHGKEVEYSRRAPKGGGTSSKVNVEEVESRLAVQEFKRRLVDPLEVAGVKVNVFYRKSVQEVNVYEDTVRVSLPDSGNSITIDLLTRGNDAKFSIDSWEGPLIESSVRMRSPRPMEELDAIASDLAGGIFEGAIYTEDGKNVMLLPESDLKDWFENNSGLSTQEKIDILKARKANKVKDKTVATILLDSMGDLKSREAADFIADFDDVLNWSYISRYMDLPEKLMRAYADKLDWKWISTKGNLSSEFILEFAERLNLDDVVHSQDVSEETMAKLEELGLL